MDEIEAGPTDQVRGLEAHAVAEEPTAARHPVDVFVDQWWADHFPGSVLGHHTEAWNYVWAAKEALRARLKQQLPS